MGYSSSKADRQRAADQKRIRDLERELEIERKRKAERESESAHSSPSNAVTIEKTSKALKMQLLACWLVLIGGLVSIVACPDFSAFAIPVGLIGVIVTKIQIWWRHG